MATPAVLTYVYIRGKWYAFPNPNSAREGAVKYNGNVESLRSSKPIGVLVDDRTFIRRPRSFWPNVLDDAQGVTGDALLNPPVNPIQGPVPVTPDPVVTPVVTPTVARTSPPPRDRGGRPDPKAADFASYVNQNPDLASAYQDYVAQQQSSDIDLWETSSTLGSGRQETGPVELSKSDWGATHWGQYGQGEKSREGKDPFS